MSALPQAARVAGIFKKSFFLISYFLAKIFVVAAASRGGFLLGIAPRSKNAAQPLLVVATSS